jgi:hypothetical protein
MKGTCIGLAKRGSGHWAGAVPCLNTMVPETSDKNWSRCQAGRTGLASAESRVSLGAALAENAGLPRECARENDARSRENPARKCWLALMY